MDRNEKKMIEYKWKTGTYGLNDMIKLNKAGNRITENSMKLLKLIFYDKNREEYKDILIEDKEVYKQYINYIRKFIEQLYYII